MGDAVEDSDLEALLAAIASSHLALLRRPLPVPAGAGTLGARLDRAHFALLCHDTSADPRFLYANRTAQRLWRLSSAEFVGMPSRLSAEPDAREVRAEMLSKVARTGYIADYAGIRIDALGNRFRILDACVWNVTDPSGAALGQAALIPRWEPVPDQG